MPPGYPEQIRDMAEAINTWLRANPSAAPVFRMPPHDVWIAVVLPTVLDRLAANDDARRVAVMLIESVSFAKCPTLFMLRAALSATPCKVEIVPVDVFTEGFAPLPIQRGGQA